MCIIADDLSLVINAFVDQHSLFGEHKRWEFSEATSTGDAYLIDGHGFVYEPVAEDLPGWAILVASGDGSLEDLQRINVFLKTSFRRERANEVRNKAVVHYSEKCVRVYLSDANVEEIRSGLYTLPEHGAVLDVDVLWPHEVGGKYWLWERMWHTLKAKYSSVSGNLSADQEALCKLAVYLQSEFSSTVGPASSGNSVLQDNVVQNCVSFLWQNNASDPLCCRIADYPIAVILAEAFHALMNMVGMYVGVSCDPACLLIDALDVGAYFGGVGIFEDSQDTYSEIWSEIFCYIVQTYQPVSTLCGVS